MQINHLERVNDGGQGVRASAVLTVDVGQQSRICLGHADAGQEKDGQQIPRSHVVLAQKLKVTQDVIHLISGQDSITPKKNEHTHKHIGKRKGSAKTSTNNLDSLIHTHNHKERARTYICKSR